MRWDQAPEATQATGASLLAAVPVVLLAGAVPFAAPCVLPLIPGFVMVV